MTAPFRPQAQLGTHDVTNQPPPLVDYDLNAVDPALKAAVAAFGDAATAAAGRDYGRALGRADMLEAGDLANRYPPEFRPFDRYGHRIDDVRFHPAYHLLMALGMAHGQHSAAWEDGGSHVRHTVLEYLMHQVEAGVCCPLSMTYAGLPALKHHPDLYAAWAPKLTSRSYDPAMRPVAEKAGATMGMAMTEKQGGSDVRANATTAEPLGAGRHRLIGHKWFCSAPMSDAFLTLAYLPDGLSCFFVPRWTEAGERNAIRIQRLKDKLGNKANASSEIEYHGAEAVLVGEPGRGVQTIIEMVHHTRLDCTVGAASLMRAGLTQALHHARHRRAFQKHLIDQPLMRQVLTDLVLEQDAAVWLTVRIAAAFDKGAENAAERALARIGVAIAKYWLNKRVANFLYEAMEVHGGAGYVEEGPMPRLYREAPLNSIWEGSGNVICLDVLRAMTRQPDSAEALMAELGRQKGAAPALDRLLDEIGALMAEPAQLEVRARRLVERLALAWQAGLLIEHADTETAELFLAARLGGTGVYGSLPDSPAGARRLERAMEALPEAKAGARGT